MLKMLTGLVAKAIGLGRDTREELPDAGLKGGVAKALAEISDAEMLDWLDRQSRWRLVAFRRSTTGRGWRLMEVPAEVPADHAGSLEEGIVIPPPGSVRLAIADAMLMASPTDAQALDWLDEQTGSYTGTVIWRLSTRGLGWRLHETSRDGAKATVREAISDAMRSGAAVNTCRAAAGAAWLVKESKDPLRIPEPSRMYCITQTGPETFECAVMAQDGFERWGETSLDAAVESVIRGAEAINHASIGRRHITIQLKDPVNAALCLKCGGLAISWHRHDFIECDCGLIAVDGGKDYNRRVGRLDDIGEIPTREMLEMLAKLPAKDRVEEWKRHG